MMKFISGHFKNLRSKSLAPVFLLFFLPASVSGQSKNLKSPFKIVGYYFLAGALRDSIPDTTYSFLDKVTHVNIAFINPDTAGVFNQEFPVRRLIEKAHQKNVKVLASIAGGGSHGYYHSLLEDEHRKVFIQNLLSVVEKYGFDGVDVDIEGRDIDSNYEKFVEELATLLHEKNLLITAAIATAYKDLLTDKALQKFDFVNIMSYDRKGPWRPMDPGNHSPYSMAVQDLGYWHHVRKIPKNKLVLGLPFYGYGFGSDSSTVVSMNFKEIMALYPQNISDTIFLPGNIEMFFNNAGTIRSKTELAIREAGGIMIWQLAGDASGEKSLLSMINVIVSQKANQ